jgi:hypothetical protein
LTAVTSVPQSNGLPGVARTLLVACLLAVAGLAVPDLAAAGTWCGNDRAETNRAPELVSGRQIHVVYAFPSDGADRFDALASPIVTDLELMDAWWRGQDPSRTPRFDLFPFPGCSGLGRLDLTKVRLPQPAAYYRDEATTLGRLALDLAASPFALAQTWAKYLVYYDGSTSLPNLCGRSNLPPTHEVGATRAVVFLQACPDDLGSGGLKAWTAAHELLHNLGGAQPGRPNACPDNPAHTCDHYLDILAPFVRSPLSSAVLDLNRDDFYGHSGGWLDVQDSPWLYRLDGPRPVLSVAVAGSRSGKVESNWPGIACPPACSVDWDAASAVQLSAVPDDGARVVRWEGACSDSFDDVCQLTLDADKSVRAVFGPAEHRLTVTVTGRGVVRSSEGTACARRCSALLEADLVVRLRAQPRRGHRFVRWTGACRGTRTTCVVRLSADRSVRALFRRR